MRARAFLDDSSEPLGIAFESEEVEPVARTPLNVVIGDITANPHPFIHSFGTTMIRSATSGDKPIRVPPI